MTVGPQRQQIAVIGSANVDIVVDVDHRPAAGETILGSDLVTAPGGKGANQAVAAARMEGTVSFVGCVGKDAQGRMLRASLEDAGVDVSGLQSVDAPTGAAIIVVTPDGENSIIVAQGANKWVTPDLLTRAAEHWASADILVAQLEVPIESVALLARHADQSGARLILNAAPMSSLSDEVLAQCDPLVVNETEAGLLLSDEGPEGGDGGQISGAESLAQCLLARGCRSVVITLGAKGAVVADRSGVTQVRASAVRAVDTTGAGDAFVGALASELSAGRTLLDSARVAVTYAGFTVTRRSAQASYPHRSELA